MTDGTIDTYSGRVIDVHRPDPDLICLEDIAIGLGHSCRFNGHCKTFYSVAQHCVLGTALLTTAREKLLFLLHDAAEAYIGDMSRPIKQLCPEFRALEEGLLGVIHRAFGLHLPSAVEQSSLKSVDEIMLATEKELLLPQVIRTWPGAAEPTQLPAIRTGLASPWQPARACQEYEAAFRRLSSDLLSPDVNGWECP